MSLDKVQSKESGCTLDWLLSPWLTISLTTTVKGINLDSREIHKGELFVALIGAVNDGRTFIPDAIAKEASAVLSETKDPTLHGHVNVEEGTPIISFFELGHVLNAIAMRYYFMDSTPHQITAITGTNGKTTIATLLANCYQLLGKKSAQMGTIGNGLYGQLKASSNTTLDAVSVCRELQSYQSQDAEKTVMEVSSHGLLQGRVAAIPFTTAIFTNLTRDHLDYHGTMQAYAEAKEKLFKDFTAAHKIINADDPIGKTWLTRYPDAIAYGVSADTDLLSSLFLKVEHVTYLAQGVTFDFTSSWGKGTIYAPFYGDFNVSNIAAVCCALLSDGYSINQIQTVVSHLTVVPGRMEQYYFAVQKLTFVVDYAHTPDALKNALTALSSHKLQGRLIAVFGCGGDRDKGKRPEMGRIAEQYAEQIVIVDDNPRSENASTIIDDIKQGLNNPEKALIIHDRQQAILHLLKTACANDIILIAGKGHEDYQIFGNTKVHYSDRECLSALLTSMHINTDNKQELLR